MKPADVFFNGFYMLDPYGIWIIRLSAVVAILFSVLPMFVFIDFLGRSFLGFFFVDAAENGRIKVAPLQRRVEVLDDALLGQVGAAPGSSTG